MQLKKHLFLDHQMNRMMKRTILSIAVCCMSFSLINAQQLPDPVTGTFTDPRDGKTYTTVKIGDQVWMAENLAYLPAVSGPSTGSQTEPFMYVYGYDGTDVEAAKATTNYSTYGVLYNWPAALTACPAGWHLPSDAEWTTLTDYLINNGYGFEGSGTDIAKSMAATTNWNLISTAGTPGNDPASNNSSGFSGLPGGGRYYGGYFYGIGNDGDWWSSTEFSADGAWYRYLYYYSPTVGRYGNSKEGGFSVRCVRDESNSADRLSVNLKSGWNMFSTNVVPDSTDLKTLFKGLIDDGNLLKIQDELGNAIEDIGDYGEWVNQIGNIALTEGYRIEVNDSVNIQFVGETAEFPFEIPLKAGWNIIGFPRSSDLDAMEVVQQLIDRQTLMLVQDENGNTLENNGSTGEWVNGIGDFKPGKGYKVRVKSDDVLLFGNLPPELPFNPSPADSAVNVEPTAILSWACNDPEGDQLTYDFYRGTSPDSLVLIKDDLEDNSYYSGLLLYETVYYWKVTATDSHGNSTEGPLWTFWVGNETGSFIDSRDNNTYKTVKIGDQWWMARNLAYLPSVSGPSTGSETEPFMYILNYDGNDVEAAKAASNYSKFGVLYNWAAALTACPEGWHLPSDSEWTTLTDYLINNGYGYEGSGDDIAKSMAATTNWPSSSTPGTPGNDPASNNSSGFSALPGGCRRAQGYFDNFTLFSEWWSSTEESLTHSWYRALGCDYSEIFRYNDMYTDGLSVRCVKNVINTSLSAPTLSTIGINDIQTTSATCIANITSDGGSSISTRGFCWNTSGSPTTSDETVNNGSGTGRFTSVISGLSANTLYYVRSFATNEIGTVYGDELFLKTYNDTITDIDGNVYHTITIGTQTWLVENLKTTHYRNGDSIPNIIDNIAWKNLTTGGYCNYDNNKNKASTFGRLYNWYSTSDPRNIAPEGWHIPTDAEWIVLINYLVNNGYGIEGTAWIEEKSMATTSYWGFSQYPGSIGYEVKKNNKSGFSAVPGGFRNVDGTFWNNSNEGFWWLSINGSSNNWFKTLCSVPIHRYWLEINKNLGFSIRCIKD